MSAPEPRLSLEDLFERILEERRRGGAPDIEGLARAHPELAAELRELLPAMEVLERRGAAERTPRRAGEAPLPTALLERLASRGSGEGRYEIRTEIGRGGQGTVIAIWDRDLRRELAMKLLLARERGTGSQPKSLGRFLEEAQVTAQLDHPGIVPVHELGLDAEGALYFTMKLVKGSSLLAVFDLARREAEGWTQTRVLHVLLKVCEAMAYAHSKGVVHRDLKPSNVMVGRFGEVYVMDWGLARVLGREDRNDIRLRPASATSEVRTERHGASLDLDSPLVTMEGDVVGTPAYMAPEQARGEREAIGPPADVFAVGAMLYQLLAGHMPYVPPGTRLSSHAVWALVQRGPPEPLQTLAPDASPELVAIAEKAMARNAGQRYPDMGALAEVLRAYLENRVVSAHRTGALAELSKWFVRNRRLALLGSATIVLALGGLAGIGYVQAKGRRAADAQRANVLRLSAFQELKDLKREAEELWPPWTEHETAYVDWLRRAKALVAGLDPDPASGDLGHRARLAELESRALPRTEAELEADRRSHPRFSELERLEASRAALERAQAVRKGKAEVEELHFDAARLSSGTATLNALAWMFVGPDKKLGDSPKLGLALARLAAAGQDEDSAETRAGVLDTLAWALLANGLDEEAAQRSAEALDLAPEGRGKEFRAYRERLMEQTEAARSGAAQAAMEEARESLEAELATRRTWRFATEEDRWWHSQLVELVAEIQDLGTPETGLIDGFSPEHGLGIARRRAVARDLAERSLAAPEAQRAWAEALASIADPRACPAYGGLEIEPQMGLLPIGRDPASGLWEFAHLQSGEPAWRAADGTLALEEETGLVFVLLPGGTFTMGAQARDPLAPHYDPDAKETEGPVHAVSLSPFFLSKYEMTQGQWLRVQGSNPSHAGPHFWQAYWNRSGTRGDLTHPVERVSWVDCSRVCHRMGCVLPSEARWEYGARGGTSTPWWTGDRVESLAGAANVADAYALGTVGEQWNGNERALDDGHAWHAPVDSFRPNPFGLHNVHGNVSEFCLDPMWGSQFYLLCALEPALDPLAPDLVPGTCSGRGGTFFDRADFARSANRGFGTIEQAHYWHGLRPACEIRGAVRRRSPADSAR